MMKNEDSRGLRRLNLRTKSIPNDQRQRNNEENTSTGEDYRKTGK